MLLNLHTGWLRNDGSRFFEWSHNRDSSNNNGWKIKPCRRRYQLYHQNAQGSPGQVSQTNAHALLSTTRPRLISFVQVWATGVRNNMANQALPRLVWTLHIRTIQSSKRSSITSGGGFQRGVLDCLLEAPFMLIWGKLICKQRIWNGGLMPFLRIDLC